MKKKALLKYLHEKAEEYWEKARKCILKGESRAWFEGKADAYEDVIYQIEKPYLEG